jgi:hypothetical protein
MAFINDSLGRESQLVHDTDALAALGGVTLSPLVYSAGPTLLTLDATSTGKTLATLKGSALATALKAVSIYLTSGIGTFAAGSASGSSPLLPTSMEELRLTKTQADTFKLFSTSGATAVLIEWV